MLDLIVQHRGWALPLASVVSFAESVVSFAESLAFVSLIVPGSVILAAAGVLVGSGQLTLWPLLLGALPGAVLGHAISYWLGRHYGGRIRQVWPFSRRPGLLMRGLAFADRHGGKSVFLGRFFRPVRAVVPLAAEMLALPAARFWAANVGSALLWASIVLALGALAGAGLGGLFEAGLTGSDWLTLVAILVPVLAAAFLGIRLLCRGRWRPARQRHSARSKPTRLPAAIPGQPRPISQR